MIDFHTHILPGIDDGSKSTVQSLKMLDMMSSSGVTAVVASPHLYLSRMSVEEFLQNRDLAYDRLMEAAVGKNLPQIYKAAEVEISTDLIDCKKIQSLCVEGTSYIMLEMPYTFWSEWVFRLVEDIIKSGLTPIIVHIERFIEHGLNKNGIERLLAMEVIAQVNTGSVISPLGRKRALRLIKDKHVSLIGSDCHNDSTRPPNMGRAFDIIQKKLGQSAVDEIDACSAKILGRLFK